METPAEITQFLNKIKPVKIGDKEIKFVSPGKSDELYEFDEDEREQWNPAWILIAINEFEDLIAVDTSEDGNPVCLFEVIYPDNEPVEWEKSIIAENLKKFGAIIAKLTQYQNNPPDSDQAMKAMEEIEKQNPKANTGYWESFFDSIDSTRPLLQRIKQFSFWDFYLKQKETITLIALFIFYAELDRFYQTINWTLLFQTALVFSGLIFSLLLMAIRKNLSKLDKKQKALVYLNMFLSVVFLIQLSTFYTNRVFGESKQKELHVKVVAIAYASKSQTISFRFDNTIVKSTLTASNRINIEKGDSIIVQLVDGYWGYPYVISIVPKNEHILDTEDYTIPDQLVRLLVLANHHYWKGNYVKARELYERISNLYPSSPISTLRIKEINNLINWKMKTTPTMIYDHGEIFNFSEIKRVDSTLNELKRKWKQPIYLITYKHTELNQPSPEKFCKENVYFYLPPDSTAHCICMNTYSEEIILIRHTKFEEPTTIDNDQVNQDSIHLLMKKDQFVRALQMYLRPFRKTTQ